MTQIRFQDMNDKELLARFENDGNNEWLGILLQRYTLLLYGLCMKYLKNEENVKDAVQQVFLKVVNELPKYKVEYFKSWLYMVAKNHCLMQLRNKGRFVNELDDHISDTLQDHTDLDKAIEKDYNLSLMEKALKLLNEDQQLCITLFYLHKKTYQDVADKTGLTVLQVKSHLQNGKRNLKIHMQKMQDEQRP